MCCFDSRESSDVLAGRANQATAQGLRIRQCLQTILGQMTWMSSHLHPLCDYSKLNCRLGNWEFSGPRAMGEKLLIANPVTDLRVLRGVPLC